MGSKNTTKSLYRYSIIYFILSALTMVLFYMIFLTKKFNLRPLMILSLLLIILLSNSIFMLYLIKKIYIYIRRSEKSKLELLKYKYLENDLKTYRQHRHDMTNHLTVIYELVNKEKYDDLEKYTQEYLKKTNLKLKSVESGSDEIDVLLYHKISDAKTHYISVDYHIKPVLSLAHQTLMDIVSILSNLLDNAIEANKQISDFNQRALNITITDDPLDYLIVVTNAFIKTEDPNQFQKNGFTTKTDAINHGMGLSIVSKIVERYSGQMSIEVLNDLFFQVKIDLPKHRLK